MWGQSSAKTAVIWARAATADVCGSGLRAMSFDGLGIVQNALSAVSNYVDSASLGVQLGKCSICRNISLNR